MAGYSFPRIATELGFAGPSGAYKAVMTLLDETAREPADALRKIELERLEALFAACYVRALKGELFAIDRALKIIEVICRLEGMYRPITMNVNWRAEAESQGLKASDIFEQIVASMLSGNGTQPSGSPPAR